MKPLRQFLLKIGGRQITHLLILLRLQDPMKLYVLLFGSPENFAFSPGKPIGELGRPYAIGVSRYR
jgi:hypothetical protein